MANRSQIGRGTFEVRQNGRNDASAWVYSDSATTDETWIWIDSVRNPPGTGDQNRVLKTPLGANNQNWRFVEIGPFADLTAFLTYVNAIPNLRTQYKLVGFTHGKVVVTGFEP